MKKNLNKVIFYLVSLIVPLSIIGITEIWRDINFQTFLFFIITSIVYITGVVLVSPILDVIKEFDNVLNQYKNTKNIEDMSSQKRYKRLLQGVNKNKIISRYFNDFKKSLKSVKGDIDEYGEETINYYSTNDIEYYFDDDNLIYKNIKSRTINQITASLTAIGIFGTFLGIVQGVSGLNLEDSEAMKNGIVTLLSGIKTSFNSSLYGIMFSVILTFLLKIVIDIAMNKANEFCYIVSTIISPYTEQSALSDLENELKKQTSTFEDLATNIAEIIGRKFDESINVSIDRLSENIENSMIQMQYSMASAITSIKENKDSKNDMNIVKETMDMISNKNSEMLDTLKVSMDNMKKLAKYQENVVKNTTNSTKTINDTTSNIKELQESLSESIANLNAANSTSTLSLENVKNAIEAMESSIGKVVTISTSLETMINKSSILSEYQYKYMERFENVSKIMTDSIISSQDSMGKISKEINSYKDNFENIKDSSLQVFTSLNKGYNDIDTNVKNANDKLLKTIEALDNNILARIDSTGDKFTKVLDGLDKFQNNSNEMIEKIERFAKVEERTVELWDNYDKSFTSLNRLLNEGVENYTKNVSSGVNNLFSQYDASISNAIVSLRKMIEILNSSVESIAESINTEM